MKYIEFDETRKMDLVLLGRVAIDFNPAYNDQVKEGFKPLKKVHMFEKFVGGSPANIAVGVTRHGLKTGFIGKVSDDQFGEFVTDYFNEEGIDTSHITKSAREWMMSRALHTGSRIMQRSWSSNMECPNLPHIHAMDRNSVSSLSR